jgi:purine-cytosine permease-like protein
MGFGLLLKVALCVVGALLLVAPFSNRRRFRKLVFQNPVCVWMAKRRPDLSEQVVHLFTAAWIFGVIVVVVSCWIMIETSFSPASP